MIRPHSNLVYQHPYASSRILGCKTPATQTPFRLMRWHIPAECIWLPGTSSFPHSTLGRHISSGCCALPMTGIAKLNCQMHHAQSSGAEHVTDKVGAGGRYHHQYKDMHTCLKCNRGGIPRRVPNGSKTRRIGKQHRTHQTSAHLKEDRRCARVQSRSKRCVHPEHSQAANPKRGKAMCTCAGVGKVGRKTCRDGTAV